MKFEHTVFALPFAYGRVPRARRGAERSAGRLGDPGHGRRALVRDGRQPSHRRGHRRAEPAHGGRELLQGTLRPWQVAPSSAVSLAVFLLAVFNLDPIVRWLWPIPVAMFVVYPYLKRVTWLSHAWLGATLGLAPVGGWVAMGELPLAAWLLGAAVAAWVAGFDLFYAISDIEIDRAQGLHSFPARFGVGAAFWGARVLHVATLLLLAWPGSSSTPASSTGWAWAVAGLLAYEHAIVSPGDLRRLNTAFFTLNGVISIVFFGFVLLDVAT